MEIIDINVATLDDLEITSITGHKWHGFWYISVIHCGEAKSGNGRTFKDAIVCALWGLDATNITE